MAEIVLIQPYTGAWDEMSTRFPESLLAVAAVPVSKGYDVKIIDQRISQNFEQELAAVVGPETRIFGVTVITGQQIKFALEATEYLKKTYPSIPVCWGGVHATLLPEQTAAHPLIDYVVVGDGDFVFCELFERLRDGHSAAGLRGVVYKDDSGRVVSNAGILVSKQHKQGQAYSRQGGQTDIVRDLDILPELPYGLLELGEYSVFCIENGYKSATLSTSRGCLYRCKFCSDPVINQGHWRGYSAGRVLEKVDLLYRRYGYRLIYFQDDYFPGNKKRFIKILHGMAKYKRKLLWSTLGIRADILAQLTAAELDLLYESGCHSLEVGIESGNPHIIQYVNKGETLEQMRLANQRLAQYDIKVKYTLIVGFPDETEDEVKDTVRFAIALEEANPNAYCLIFNFLPIVGTPFYEQALQRGLVQPQSLEEWAGMDFDGWMKKYRHWISPQLVRKLEAISFVSYFHNRNVAYKFGGSRLLRLAFQLYHPIAAWRFKHQFFDYCFEVTLKDWLLQIKYTLRKMRLRPTRVE